MKAKIHYLKDIPECDIRKGDVEEVSIPASYRFNDKEEDSTVWCPDCMDEVSEYIEPIILNHLKSRGYSGNRANMFYGGEDDDKDSYKKLTPEDIEYINKYKMNNFHISSVCQLRGSKYYEDTLTVDHTFCELIDDRDTYFIENIIDIIEYLTYYSGFYVPESRIKEILNKITFDNEDDFRSSFADYINENIGDMRDYGDLEISTIFQLIYHINCLIENNVNLGAIASEIIYYQYQDVFRKALKDHVIGYSRLHKFPLLMQCGVYPTYKDICDEIVQKYKT